MRLVLISDTHQFHDRVSIPNGDVLIHAGDFCRGGAPSEIEAFSQWLSGLPHKHKLVVAGNHDTLFETAGPIARVILSQSGCTYLQDAEATIEGLKFYGSPWQPKFCDWAFNLPRDGSELKDVWARIPDDTDVLITHCPPFGVLDVCADVYTGAPISVGCRHLERRVSKVKPKLHVFGHIHEGYGIVEISGTTFANAAICTGTYDPVQQPHVIDL